MHGSFIADATVGRSYDDVVWLAERATCPYVISYSIIVCLRRRRLTDCRIDKHRAAKSQHALHVEYNTQRYMKTIIFYSAPSMLYTCQLWLAVMLYIYICL